MSIGATLAEARHEAGLTVADVSARTYIRESLIRAIEQDEFASCGGDVYARGHIRAIASVVGADADALIADYDAAHHYGGAAPLEDVLRPPPPPPVPPPPPPVSSPQGRRRHGWLVPALMLCCLVGVVFVAYQLTGTAGAKRPQAAASPKRPAAASHARSRGSPSPGHASASSAPTPPPAPAAVPVTQLTPVSAAAFGPGGTSDGDNPQNASLALSGDAATPWHTDWYTTARFGNLQQGTGLLLDLGRTVTATKVTIHLGSTPGANVQVRAGTTASDLHTAASAGNAAGTTTLRLAAHPRTRYVLVWFTQLPLDAAGTYQATVSGVTVTATIGN